MRYSDTSLERILWIGGGTDAGKTTTATVLSEKLDFLVYHYDRSSGAAEQLGRNKAPRTFEWKAMSEDERWSLRHPEEIALHTFEAQEETFPVKLQEILAMTRESWVIAEGFAFTPKLIAPLLSSVNQAIWMVPTEAFKRNSFKRRGKDKDREREGSLDPVLATQNQFDRDMIMAAQMREAVETRGLKLLEVDGSRSSMEIATIVEAHFEPYLKSTNSSD